MTFEVKAEGWTYLWRLDPEFRKLLDPIAAEFGWTPEVFLERYCAGRRQIGSSLPGQFPKAPDADDEPEINDLFSVAEFCHDEGLWLRIRNAAKLECQTPREFIWRTIWGMVCEAESKMIVSPLTGRFLVDPDELHKFELSSHHEETEQ